MNTSCRNAHDSKFIKRRNPLGPGNIVDSSLNSMVVTRNSMYTMSGDSGATMKRHVKGRQ